MYTLSESMVNVLNQRLAANNSATSIVPKAYDNIDMATEIEYDDVTPDSTPLVIDHTNYTNCSDVEQEITDSVKKTVEDSSKWTTDVGVDVEVTIETELGAIIAKTKEGASVKVSYQQGHETSHTDSVELSTDVPLKIPARTVLTAQAAITVLQAQNVHWSGAITVLSGTVRARGSGSIPLYRYVGPNSHSIRPITTKEAKERTAIRWKASRRTSIPPKSRALCLSGDIETRPIINTSSISTSDGAVRAFPPCSSGWSATSIPISKRARSRCTSTWEMV